MPRLIKKFLSIIPYIAILYFISARSFIILGQFGFIDNYIEKLVIENSIDNHKVQNNSDKHEISNNKNKKNISKTNRIWACFSNFYNYLILFIATFLYLIICKIIFIFTLKDYKNVGIIFLRPYLTRAPPLFS